MPPTRWLGASLVVFGRLPATGPIGDRAVAAGYPDRTCRRSSRSEERSVWLNACAWLRRRTLDAMVTPVSTFDEAVMRLRPKVVAVRALGVERLAMFGSVVRGEARPDSDADVLVRFAEGSKTYERFLDLAELLEDVLGRPVELVTVESLSPILGPKILAEARDVVRAP